ncbi:MAG: CDP-alcohol phosphatidyltransferase family protein [bacterium]
MRRHLPNLLTTLRFPLTLLFLYGSFQLEAIWKVCATLAFLLSMLTDFLDGLIARRMNATTSVGTFLDPLADKFLVLSGFFVLLVRPDLHWGAWKIWVLISVGLVALRELAVTVLRSWRAVSDRPIVTTVWGKAKTTVQMITLVAALLLLNARDIYHWHSESVLDFIAFGILASAALAVFSAGDYFHTVATDSSATESGSQS